MQKTILRALVVTLMIAYTATSANAAKQATNSADFEKGVYLLNSGYKQEALQSFQQSIKDYKNVAECYKNIAIIMHADGKIEEAIIALDKSLLETPSVENYILQAAYYEEYGSKRSAIRVINKAIDMEPTNTDLYAIRARLKEALGEENSAMIDYHIIEELKAGRTDVLKNNPRVFKTYTVSPMSNKNLKSGDRIQTAPKK